MLSILRKKAQCLLGVDISPTAVKLLELSHSDGGYRVESYVVEVLPPGAVAEKAIADVEAVGDVISRLVARVRPKTKQAAVAVAAASAITKVVEMEAGLSDDDREMQLRVEADQHIPFPLEDVRMDFQVLGPLDNNPDRVNVLLVASRTDNVQMRTDALEIGGLKPAAVDVETYAIERAFGLICADGATDLAAKTVAIFDVGASQSALIVLHEGRVVYNREMSFGGEQLTTAIQQRYSLSPEEARVAKRSGELPSDYTREVLQPFADALVQQAGRSLQFFYGSSRFTQVDQLLLAGGSASIAGLAEQASAEVGVGCSVANPLAGMRLSSKVSAQLLANDAPSLLVACGLAMREAGRRA